MGGETGGISRLKVWARQGGALWSFPGFSAHVTGKKPQIKIVNLGGQAGLGRTMGSFVVCLCFKCLSARTCISALSIDSGWLSASAGQCGLATDVCLDRAQLWVLSGLSRMAVEWVERGLPCG